MAKKAKSVLEAAPVAVEVEGESVPAGQLGDWLEKVPAEVQEAADEYVGFKREKQKAHESMNAARDRCIKKMKEHGVPKVRIDDGEKYLVCVDEAKLKTEKLKGQGADGDE